MNFLQKFVFNTLARSLPNTYLSQLYQLMGQGNVIWVGDNAEAYLLEGYGGNPDVFSIVNRIIQMGSAIPWKVQESKNGKMVDIPEHELQWLMENPNPMQGQSEFIGNLLGFYCLTGENFIYAPFLENGNNKGKTKELWSMPPQLTNIHFGEAQNPIGGYSLYWSPKDVTPAEFVCHTKTFNPFFGNGQELRGMSPLRAGRKPLTLGNSALTANVRAFDNMGASGILGRHEGAETEFTQSQAESLEQRWRTDYSGPENFRKIVMTGANVKWTQIGLSPVDLNIMQREEYNTGQLCNLWGMPSELFNDKRSSTYNNMEQANRAAYIHGVLPPLYTLRDNLNRWLSPRYGKGIYLTPDTSNIEVLQDNKKEQAEWLAKSYWISVPDKQRIMGVNVDSKLEGVYCDPNGMLLSFEPIEPEIDAAIDDNAKNQVEDY